MRTFRCPATFEAGSVTGLGWIAGFALIGFAALAGGSVRGDRSWARYRRPCDPAPQCGGRPASMLPSCRSLPPDDGGPLRFSDGNDRVTGIVVVPTFIGVLIRQYLTIRDNVS